MVGYTFSKHAMEQIAKRGIREDIVMKVLSNPDQIIKLRSKHIYQALIITETAEKFLIRVFVNCEVIPNIIITAYKTSKIDKYYEGKI